VRAWRFLTLLLVTLTLGLSFAHTLELPAKLEYDGRLYITIQQTLYRWWGPPLVGAALEPAAVLATAVLAFLVRARRTEFMVTLGSTLLLLLAFPVVFFLAVEPANAVFRQATPEAVPADWMQLRLQWEYGHATRFALHLTAFASLLASVLIGRPQWLPRAGNRESSGRGHSRAPRTAEPIVVVAGLVAALIGGIEIAEGSSRASDAVSRALLKRALAQCGDSATNSPRRQSLRASVLRVLVLIAANAFQIGLTWRIYRTRLRMHSA
jgi:hypothetical protein